MKEEYKLIFLTLFVRLGLGTIIVYTLIGNIFPYVSEFTVSLSALAITCVGLGLSLFHVGKPTRIMNTFANKKSAMSWEAIIAPLLCISMSALVVLSYLNPENDLIIIPRVLSAALAIIFIYVTGKVYHLRARRSWNTTLVLYEYFTSAAILGLLGYAFIMLLSGKMSPDASKTIGYILIPLIIIETLITFRFRERAMDMTVTAKRVLSSKRNKYLYLNFIILGLLSPFALAITFALGIQVQATVPAALAAFMLGAVWWRVLFFRSATLIKITPDIAV